MDLKNLPPDASPELKALRQLGEQLAGQMQFLEREVTEMNVSLSLILLVLQTGLVRQGVDTQDIERVLACAPQIRDKIVESRMQRRRESSES